MKLSSHKQETEAVWKGFVLGPPRVPPVSPWPTPASALPDSLQCFHLDSCCTLVSPEGLFPNCSQNDSLKTPQVVSPLCSRHCKSHLFIRCKTISSPGVLVCPLRCRHQGGIK